MKGPTKGCGPRGANSAPSQRPLADTRAPDEGDGVHTSPTVGDRIAKTTCYMCACRCGIDVHIQDGTVRYIAGNKDHPVNRGVLCGKGSAGIMQHYSPARLKKPLLRTGPRGSGEFREIEWEEALTIATERLGRIRAHDPKRLAFFTGRDQSQSLTGWWASRFGTPNYAAHGGFCSVNMAAGGLYTIGGSFWEFGQPDWDHTKYFMLFGVAEDHDSNPIKIGLGRLKARGARIVSVNPCRTGYNAIADDWIGIRPGTDGLFVLAVVHELLKAGRIDLDYLIRYTNAPYLVIEEPGASDDGLLLRDEQGKPLVWNRSTGSAAAAAAPDINPALTGRYEVGGRRCVPAFGLIAERYLDPGYAPDAVAGALRRPRRHDPARGRGACPRRLRAGHRAARRLDGHGRPPPRHHAGAARRHARHARHLGPLQRLSHLPGDPPAAGAARHASMCRAASASSRPIPRRRRPGRSRAARMAAGR